MSEVTADQALARLREGNLRFQKDPRAENWTFDGPHPSTLTAGQRPFAAVLGCADSRVPVEVVFGQGPGQLFVVRVAGNVASPSQLGSLEFAVDVLDVRLVVVLGHTNCGLVSAALAPPTAPLPRHLAMLARRVAGVLGEGGNESHAGEAGGAAASADSADARLRRAISANVRATCREILEGSEVIAARAASGDVMVTGAVYELESGMVTWLEG
jgi:carbonic anhydrase